MIARAFLCWWGGHQPMTNADLREFDYITVNKNGSATFDVASWLMTPEGQKQINEIAATNRQPPTPSGRE